MHPTAAFDAGEQKYYRDRDVGVRSNADGPILLFLAGGALATLFGDIAAELEPNKHITRIYQQPLIPNGIDFNNNDIVHRSSTDTDDAHSEQTFHRQEITLLPSAQPTPSPTSTIVTKLNPSTPSEQFPVDQSQATRPPWQLNTQPQYATVPAIGQMRASSWAPRMGRTVPYVASDSLSPLQGNTQTLSNDDPAYQQWINNLWQPFSPPRPIQPTILDSPPQILPGIIMQSPPMSDMSDPLSQQSPTSLPISPLMERRGSGPDRNAPSSSRNSVPTPYSRCRCPKNGGKPSRHWRTACPYNPDRSEAPQFECNICAQKFNRKDNLTRHLRNRHNAEPEPEA
ncbi:hypothetical protein FS837_009524 [Tulasnella sp. UAMH 9824]|nr:hypothetical protein FS837_009524 [Tulasnella sp. UAMH 9824]